RLRCGRPPRHDLPLRGPPFPGAILTMVLDIIGVVITFLAVGVGAWFIGPYLHRVFTGRRVFLSPVVRPVEPGFYWLGGVQGGGVSTGWAESRRRGSRPGFAIWWQCWWFRW